MHINNIWSADIVADFFHAFILITFSHMTKIIEKTTSCQNSLISGFVKVCSATKPIEMTSVATR